MDAKKSTTPLLVSRKEAAEMLGVCTRTVFNLNKSGELPVKRVGKRVLIARVELERFAGVPAQQTG